MAELKELRSPKGALTQSVIFVHGLTGDIEGTWTSPPPPPPTERLWPKWLGEDIDGLAVWSVGYDAPVSDWSGSTMDLMDRAENVLGRLLLRPELKTGDLIFIGHSLGGLVIKQMLRLAADRAPDEAEADAKSLVDRLRKVAFLATPHLGSDLADTGDWWRLFVRPSGASQSLLKNDSHLRDLNKWYRRWARRRNLQHLILVETKETVLVEKKFGKISKIVVTPDSSDPGLAVEPVPIDADHIAIAKPANRDAEVYDHVLAFMRKPCAPMLPLSLSVEIKQAIRLDEESDIEPALAATKIPEETPAEREAILALARKAEEAGLQRDTIVALAKKIRPDDTMDFETARKELASAVEIALDAIAKGERGSNDDAFVDGVLKELAALTKAGDYDNGSRAVDGALKELATRRQEQEDQYRRSEMTLLEAGVEQDILRRDAAAVARRLEQLAAAREPGERPAWTVEFRSLQDRYYEEGTQKGVNFSLEIAIALARRMLATAENADERGAAGVFLGNALMRLGERESGTGRLEAAVAAYRAALTEYTQERVPLDWAGTQNNLGAALKKLGERESGTGRLEEAVVSYRAALTEATQERAPLDWAMTQNNLGNALRALGERESGTDRLEEAVVSYRAALTEWTQERVPLQWAATQNNLGNALRALGERESGTATLQEAVTAYRAALTEWTRERVPLDWAGTQNNLGLALHSLGERESGTATLHEAVAAYRAALTEVTQERVPLQWAGTQNNLGLALHSLGERESGTATLQEAIAAFRAALTEWTPERIPYWHDIAQKNLAICLALLEQRRQS